MYGNMDKKESWYIMGKVSNEGQKLLPEFQKFLLERKLVPEKNMPYFAYWVSRFLAFARKRAVSYKPLALSYKIIIFKASGIE